MSSAGVPHVIVLWQVLNLVYELAAGDADVPKLVGVLNDSTNVFGVCASDWLYKYLEQEYSLFGLTVLCSVVTVQSMLPKVRSRENGSKDCNVHSVKRSGSVVFGRYFGRHSDRVGTEYKCRAVGCLDTDHTVTGDCVTRGIKCLGDIHCSRAVAVPTSGWATAGTPVL
jgi:hypothetical protein